MLSLPGILVAAPECEKWIAKMVSTQGLVEKQGPDQSDWHPVQKDEYFCQGDKIRTKKHSRATLELGNESLVTLEQRSALSFPTLDKGAFSWILDLFQGSAFFRSRSPHQLNINTPFVNAVHEGTEFMVAVSEQQTEISVFDGRVAAENKVGRVQIDKGQIGIAKKDQITRVQALTIHPKDAVQWALYYPPIIDYQSLGSMPTIPAIQQSLNFYQQGDAYQALSALENIPEKQQDEHYFGLKASLLLTVGSVDEALLEIERAQQLEATGSTAAAIKAIIAVAKNHGNEALKLAQKATELNPSSAVAKIALSYAFQATFKISDALEATEQAVKLAPNNALAWARLAELQLSSGERSDALKSAQKAQQLNPQLDRTQTILGFAYLAQIDIDEAKTAFNEAINLNSADPLARLGLGLAKIRKGTIKEGTRDLETAVSLDPDNAIMRSYLGKAYYELRNEGYAATELAIAKEMDPNDPTPWFYDAILKQTTNRPIEAFHDMKKAIELNNNRGVYRSKLLLDEDLAARSASLGRIYKDLGFEQIGLLEGWKSQNSDPSNYSAHRLLADNYASLPRHQIARVSELLQSQLLQPLNITPVQPQLAESNLLIIDGLGPASASFNEFNPMFTRNQFNLQTSAIVGSNDTYGDEVVQSGLYDEFSYSLGQFHYETGGFRPNSDLETNIYNIFLQTRVSSNLNLQFEYRRENSEAGDLRQLFNPEFLFENSRQTLDKDLARVGFNLQFSPNINLLGNFSYSKLLRKTNKPGSESMQPFLNSIGAGSLLPFLTSALPNGFNSVAKFTNRLENWSGELQFIGKWDKVNLISGVNHIHQSSLREQNRSTVLSSSLDPNLASNLASTIPNEIALRDFGISSADLAPLIVDELKPLILDRITATLEMENFTLNHTVGYIYSILKVFDQLTFTLGGSVDSIERASSLGESLKFVRKYFSPKFGVIWQPFDTTTLRAGWFQTIKRPFASSQTLEPTQIAGFNQFFDDRNNTRSTRYGFGIDHEFTPNFTVGGEISWRKLKVPRFIFGIEPRIEFFEQKEEIHRAYAYWTPTKNIGLGAEYFFESFDRGSRNIIPLGTPLKMATHRIPLSLTFFHELGFFTKLAANYINQNVTLIGNTTDRGEHDDFWIFDATIGYRLPKRHGIISFGVKNIFDNRFKFQDTNFNVIGAIEDDLLPPQFVPERVIFGRITLAF